MIQPVSSMPSATEEFRLLSVRRPTITRRICSSHTVSAIIHFGLILLIIACNITVKKYHSPQILHVVPLYTTGMQTVARPSVRSPQPRSPKSGVLNPEMRHASTVRIAKAAAFAGMAVPVRLLAPLPDAQLPLPPSLDADTLSSIPDAEDSFGKSSLASYSIGNGIAGSKGGNSSQESARSCPQSEGSTRLKVENTPVEILAKPKPTYSLEAQQLHVEGEVLLEVVFQASGGIRIINITRRLGHGLDETAAAATSHIRFKPATCGGTSIDVNATIHVTFRLPKRQGNANS